MPSTCLALGSGLPSTARFPFQIMYDTLFNRAMHGEHRRSPQDTVDMSSKVHNAYGAARGNDVSSAPVAAGQAHVVFVSNPYVDVSSLRSPSHQMQVCGDNDFVVSPARRQKIEAGRSRPIGMSSFPPSSQPNIA